VMKITIIEIQTRTRVLVIPQPPVTVAAGLPPALQQPGQP
jgi:hypothetical protein